MVTQEYVTYVAIQAAEAMKTLAIFGGLHARKALSADQDEKE
jgi:hypothetical protein